MRKAGGKTRVLLISSRVDSAELGRILRRVRRVVGNATLTVVAPAPRSRRVEEVLSPRQIDVLRELASGRGPKEIASRLGISRKTVDTHRWNISRKLGIWDLPGFVRYALQVGVLSPLWLRNAD